jgi:uncharacterized protein (DUF58 family)
MASGVSLELLDHREYQPGDDIRLLDWNASARRDHEVIKLLQEEVSPSLDLVLDGSSSMGLEVTPKAEASVGLVALLATAAASSGWAARTWYSGTTSTQIPAAGLIPEAWPTGLLDEPTGPETSFRVDPPRWPARGMRLLITDLMWPGDPRPVLHRLVNGASVAGVLQVVARQDLEPPETGHLRLVDSETRAVIELAADPSVALAYRRALARHQELWLEAARRLGVLLVTIIAEDLVSSWRPDELVRSRLLELAP